MAREFRTSPDFKTAVLANGSAGTSGQVLTSAGAGAAPSWTTVSGGGGGLSQFVESEATASPNATVPVDALTATDATYANIDVAFVAKGTGATLAQVPTGTTAGGNKRGAGAVDWQKNRTAASHVASAQYGTIGGGSENTVSSNYSFVGGGQSNIAQSNTHAAVCGGNSNTASGQHAFVGSGLSNTASGARSSIAGGDSNTASGVYATVCGGWSNTSDGNSSFASGKLNTARGIESNFVFGGSALPSLGNSQSGNLVLGVQTTGASATVLTSNQSAASTSNQCILPNNSAYSFSGEVIAGVTGGGNTARWTISGAIKRGANAASTAMVGTPTVTMTHNDAGAAAWTVAVTADTTNGCIAVTVTGAAATTIRWVCRINTTEMSF